MARGTSIKSGLIFSFLSQYAGVIINLVVTTILSRLLTPSDYGIIAVSLVFIVFFSLLSDMGFGASVIQNHTLSQRDLLDLFKISLILAFVLAFGFFEFSHIIVWFYNNPVYLNVGRLMSIIVWINAANTIPQSKLQKDMRFGVLGTHTVISNLIAGFVAVILAFGGYKYYAIILQSIISSALIFLMNYRSSGIRWKRGLRFNVIHKVFSFSLYQFLYNLVNYFARNLDNLLIGRVINVKTLGFYNQAYKLMQYPLQYLSYIIGPVFQSGFSRYQNQKKTLYHKFLQLITVLSALGFWIAIVCCLCSREFVLILYGPQWIPTISIFRILSLSIGFQIVMSMSSAMFLSAGSSKHLFVSGLINTASIVTAILIGVIYRNLLILSGVLATAYFVNFFITFFIYVKLLMKSSYRKFLKSILPVFISTAISFTIASLLPIKIDNLFLSLIFKFATITLLYLVCLFLFGQMRLIFKVLSAKLYGRFYKE